MKKLITDNPGGFPFVLDDLRWIESGNQEVFKALVAPYLPYSDVSNAIIISGLKVEYYGGIFLLRIEEGYVYSGSEVFYCPGIYFSDVPNIEYNITGRICMRIKEDFDESEAGNKVFQIGGNPIPVYVNRTVELIYVGAGSPLPPDTVWLPSVSVLDAIGRGIGIIERGFTQEFSLGRESDGSISINHNHNDYFSVIASVEILSGGSNEGARNDVTLTFARTNNSITFWLHNFENRAISVRVHYMFIR